ncbi:hypothetical protein OSB04_005798 [Centaurea solstitialis]|uniref:RING-type domain-containing protein n=1 Tax=Centaurea solstitialis TaxID=347529 RepID=A0AA38TGQ7_9ASTR|nr:hypothetical protein OSB04_005798 [Centaurea solstitialis]
MRCNACWQELEGRAISTTCGHIFCNEDASKILSNDAGCPICDQVLSKSLMKPVDINPSEEWTNMAMAGISPQILMKSAYRSVTFYVGQKELELQFKMKRIVAQCRQKCEAMQEKFTQKLEQVHTAYQKMAKRCQMMEQEIESLTKDKQELQEKFSEKSRLATSLPIISNLAPIFAIGTLEASSSLLLPTYRQMRKLEEMYDQLRSEYESIKRSAIQPANNFFSRAEPDLFASPANMMDSRDSMRKDWSVLTPETSGPHEDIWPPTTRQNSGNFGQFDISSSSRVQHSTMPVESRRPGHSMFIGGGGGGSGGDGGGASNPSMTLRNLILSPMKRPQLSRSRPQLFT